MSKKKRIVKSGHSRRDMLTNKQERYVQELAKGKNQREAYKIAYPASQKWKPSAVDSQASKLIANSKVSQRLAELKAEIASKTVYDAAAIRSEIIEFLFSVLRADVKDDLVDGTAIKNKRWDSKNRVIYEHYDKMDAAKMLREMLGLDPVVDEEGIHIHLHNLDEYSE